jgi:hypothetical protein
MPRRYDPNGPHPTGFTLDDVPLFVNLTMHSKRRVFIADPDEGQVKEQMDDVSPQLYANWGKIMEKYKTFMYSKLTNGLPCLLTEIGNDDMVNIPVGSKEVAETIGITHNYLRKKFEQGVIKFVTKDKTKVFMAIPDEVTIDFFYNATIMDKKAREEINGG